MLLPMIQALIGDLRQLQGYLRLNIFSIGTRLWLSTLKPKYLLLKPLLKALKDAQRNTSPLLLRQEELVWRRDFNFLVILDACRYDIFAETIHDYLDGYLVPVLSPASVTIDWLKRVWETKPRLWGDVIYVSASPMINKRGLLSEFDARKLFLDVIEVWDWGWDENLSTVPPDKVNLGVRLALSKVKIRRQRNCRLVVHYVQPHAPYKGMQEIVQKIIHYESLSREIVDVAVRKLGMFKGKFSIDYILLGLLREYLENLDNVKKAIRMLYISNLRWVLSYVAKLVSEVDGRVVITADHGELLGEYGLFFHMDLPLPQLRIVPWFIVK